MPYFDFLSVSTSLLPDYPRPLKTLGFIQCSYLNDVLFVEANFNIKWQAHFRSAIDLTSACLFTWMRSCNCWTALFIVQEIRSYSKSSRAGACYWDKKKHNDSPFSLCVGKARNTLTKYILLNDDNLEKKLQDNSPKTLLYIRKQRNAKR